MLLAAQSVKAFVADSYQIVSSSSPTVPLHGNDTSKGVQILNELLSSFAGTGLMLTVAKEVTTTLAIGQEIVTFADPEFLPLATIPLGRLANLQNAWVVLNGVTYPIKDESRNTFFAAYKYDPLTGLPKYCIIKNETNFTSMRIYPAPSQAFELHVYGKFELSALTQNSTMAGLPAYLLRWLRLALARDLSIYKGRSEAWTPKLEALLKEATEDMQSVSSINLNIESDDANMLNGAWRVKSGL